MFNFETFGQTEETKKPRPIPSSTTGFNFNSFGEQQTQTEEPKKQGILRTLGEGLISSEKGFGESIGQAIGVNVFQKQAEENSKKFLKAAQDMKKLALETTDPVKRQTYLNTAQQYFDKAGQGIQDIVGELKTTKQVLGEAAGVALDIATMGTYGQAAKTAKTGQLLAKPLIKTTVPTAVTKLSSAGLKEAGQKIAGGAALGYGFDVAGNLQEGKEGFEALTPGFGTLIGAGLPALGYAYGATKEGLGAMAKESIQPTVKKAIEKAVRPSVVGKRTQKQADSYYQKAKDAVVSIINNKENLKYTDEFGEEIISKTPRSLSEFSQAIEQNKKTVFEEYNALSKAANKKGVVKFDKIVGELEKAANDEILSLRDPSTAKYAKSMAERFKKVGAIEPEQAEGLIKQFNEDLQSFYKNPTYGSGTKVQIDAMVANNLRESLDNVIMKATGEEYQKLKNLYGALSTIEKDVMHRAVIDARKNNKGLIDLTNIFSYGDIAAGLAVGEPTIVAKGLLQRGVAAFYKMKNDPNKIIKSMFKDVEKSLKNVEKIKPTSQPTNVINALFPQTGKESPKAVAETMIDKTKNMPAGLSIKNVKEVAKREEYRRLSKAWDNAPTKQVRKRIEKAIRKLMKQ